MAAKRKNEIEDLMNQINNMDDNPDEHFDEEAEKRERKQRLAKEDAEFQAVEKQFKNIAQQVGVQHDFEIDEPVYNVGPPSSKSQQQQQSTQPKKKDATEDLYAMLHNMTNVDENEHFDEAAHNQKMAQYKDDEKEFKNSEKMFAGIQSQFGVDLGQPSSKQPAASSGGKQQTTQASGGSSSGAEDNIIAQDNQFAALKDMLCITVFAHEYNNSAKYIQPAKFPKVSAHFQQKREKIQDNLIKFNSWFLKGELKVADYITKYLETSFSNQEKLKKSTKNDNLIQAIDKRLKYIQQEITILKKNPTNITLICQNAFKVSGINPELKAGSSSKNQPQQKQMSAAQILALSQDSLSIPEKIKLLAKIHKQNYNLATYYQKNLIPDRVESVKSFYLNALGESKILMDKLLAGENASIASFIETKLQVITPESYHQCSVQDFEAKKNLYIDKLDKAIKSEYDLQQMTQNQKKGAKINQLHDDSSLRIKQYEQNKSYLQQLNYNDFVLLPTIQSQNVKLDFSVDNKSIEKNTIVIMIKRLVDCKADKFKINYSFTPEQAPLSHQTDWCNQSLVFSDEKKFIMQQGKCPKDLDKKKIDIIMYVKGIFSQSEFARGSISLADLETNNTIDSALILEHKGKRFQLEYGVYIRTPISSVGSKELMIYKIVQYPPFLVNEGLEAYIQDKLSNMKSPQEVPKPVQQEQPKPQQPQQQQQQQQQQVQPPVQQQEKQPAQQPQQEEEQKAEEFQGENLIAEKFVYRDANGPELKKIQAFTQIPQGLTVEDLINLENPSKYRCISYLACGVEMIKNGISSRELTASQKRPINKIRDKFIEEKEILSIHCESGKLSGEDYIEIQKKLIDTDNKLIWVYSQIGLEEWVDFVKARKQTIINDLRDNCEVDYTGNPFP